MEIIFNNMPMPPTINSRLTVCNNRMIKSLDCRMFDKAVQIYILRLKSSLYEYRKKQKLMQ